MNTQEMIEVMQAYVQGKMIERKDEFGDWTDDSDPVWDWHYCQYRIKVEKWQPQGNHTLVLPEGVDQVTQHIDEKFLQDCIDFGIVFKDYSDAKKARQEFRKHHRLYQLALELNEGWEPDWSNRSAKYFIEDIGCENGAATWVYDQYGVGKNPIGIYFKDRKTVEKALEMIEAGALD